MIQKRYIYISFSTEPQKISLGNFLQKIISHQERWSCLKFNHQKQPLFVSGRLKTKSLHDMQISSAPFQFTTYFDKNREIITDGLLKTIEEGHSEITNHIP